MIGLRQEKLPVELKHITHIEMFEDPKQTIYFFWSQLWKPLLLLVVVAVIIIGKMVFISSLGSMSWDNTRFIPVMPLVGQWALGFIYFLILLCLYAVSVHDNLVNFVQAVKVWRTGWNAQEATKYWLRW